MWDSLLPLFTTFQAKFKIQICNVIGCQETVKLQQGNYNYAYVTAIKTNKTPRSWATYGNTVKNEITNEHVPVKEASQSKLKQLNKPWMTTGLLKSIKTKQRMYRTHFYSNNRRKIEIYKSYSNKLKKLKEIYKTNYYRTQFDKNKNNLKITWNLIGTLIQRKQKGRQAPSRLSNNGQIISSEHDIANEFNQHFVNAGPKLANSIAPENENPISYISISPVSSFVMSPVTNAQVLNHF